MAALEHYRGVKGPHLVIAPLSVIGSWINELKKWAPHFRVIRLHSSDENERIRLRREVLSKPDSFDIAITTYVTLDLNLQ